MVHVWKKWWGQCSELFFKPWFREIKIQIHFFFFVMGNVCSIFPITKKKTSPWCPLMMSVNNLTDFITRSFTCCDRSVFVGRVVYLQTQEHQGELSQNNLLHNISNSFMCLSLGLLVILSCFKSGMKQKAFTEKVKMQVKCKFKKEQYWDSNSIACLEEGR